MPVEVEECLIFPKVGADGGDAAASIPYYSEILAVASGRGQGSDAVLSCAGVSLEE